MNHFEESTPELRYKNELLNELRKLNMNMEKLIGCNAQVTETKAPPKPRGRGANKNADR